MSVVKHPFGAGRVGIARRLSTDGWDGPVDSCSERGEQPGIRGYENADKSPSMSALRTTSNGQQLADHWDLDHPFERLLVDTAVAPDACAVDWINSRLRPGERWRVVTGIPGKTGVVYTLDRATGKFLWATPTIAQNVISHIDGAPGTVLENSEVVFSATGQ